MRIGIDIDDTLTNIKHKLNEAAFNYAKSLNKDFSNIDIQINDTYNNRNAYQKKYDFNYEELKYFLGPIQEEITNNATPREFCVDIVKKLHKEGNEIYIITARDKEFHKDPYLQSEIWLNDNDIYFDKLIVNARDKKKICIEENIDILIDDSINNCRSVIDAGIEAIMIGDKKSIDSDIKCFKDWRQIYEFLSNNKIVKIIEYSDEYKEEVSIFINESMHKFIGREYKKRPDIENINDYYINNNGNFWLAIDISSKKIVGTIALENRNNQYGILKRFYINEEYQNNGIGSRLYSVFYNYVENYTKINKIYLTCGSILQKAHNFYMKKGFIQKESIDIDMHFANDDDFFIKDVYRNYDK